MRVEIVHVTRFRYSQPVFCEPLTIRLRPRENAFQRLIDFQVTLEPKPAGIADILDAEGNAVMLAWFNGATDRVTVHTHSAVELRLTNPFQFLLASRGQSLPCEFTPDERRWLHFYQMPDATAVAPTVRTLAESVRHEVKGSTVAFLSHLAERLREHFKLTPRTVGPPWPAERTLAQRSGACRDLAVLYNEACRAVGLPARFVSGYQIDEPDESPHQLHAWSEVFLPGAGWRAFDPSLGLAVADRHVALAAARTPDGAGPTHGSFRGAASMELHAVIEIHAATSDYVPPPPPQPLIA
jgi:transglutaminase-like putative cysteine protease